jgi:hypothetical protein
LLTTISSGSDSQSDAVLRWCQSPEQPGQRDARGRDVVRVGDLDQRVDGVMESARSMLGSCRLTCFQAFA